MTEHKLQRPGVGVWHGHLPTASRPAAGARVWSRPAGANVGSRPLPPEPELGVAPPPEPVLGIVLLERLGNLPPGLGTVHPRVFLLTLYKAA